MMPKQHRPDPVPFRVHPSNWQAFRVFEMCQTQWRVVGGMGSVYYQGIEYPSVVAVMDALGVKDRRRVFQQVQLIESGALLEMNRRE